MTAIVAVLFDADGVIQLAPDYLHLRLTEALGRPAHEKEVCMAEVFAAEAPALTGGIAFEVGLEAVLKRLGARCDVETVLRHWCEISHHEPILSLIRRLRRSGVYCALASNQERNRARHMSEQVGYAQAFDQEFYSCDLGHTKPSDRYFEEVIQIARLERHRTLFIDDRVENVEAARRCGLVAEQFVLRQANDGAEALGQLLRTHGLDPAAA
jgi:HAD superfamily hydrolase (TIGR01509 family)